MVAALASPSLIEIKKGGVVQHGANVYYYKAGTTEPLVVYKDSALSSPWTNPVPVDGDGMAQVVYVGVGFYKYRILDRWGATLREIDGIQGAVDPTGGGGGGGDVDPDKLLKTGEVFWRYGNGSRSGAVRLNGNTIGSDTSGATERANADCQDLFLFLWSEDPNLVVSGGRGTTAAGDWTANKSITLPDARGRGLFGLDGMGGATAAGRLAGGRFITGNATTLGSTGGEAAHVLTAAELAPHSHTISIGGVGDHAHSGYTDVQGNHAHTPDNGANVFQTWKSGGLTGPDDLGHNQGQTIFSGATGFAGNHSHNVATYGAGAHTHSASAANAGSGTAHNTLPPFLLGTFHMKL